MKASFWSRPLSRSTRLLSLLQAMRGRRGPVTALQLAQSLDVSERTIYRDLAELAVQGAPIEGEAGVGYILRPGLFLPPLMLSEDETEAVMLGLGYVDQRGDEVLKKAATVALAKIGSVLSARHELSSRHRSRSLARTESDFRRTPCPWSICAPRSEPRSGSRSPISTSKGAKPSVSFGRFNLVLWKTLAWWSLGANCAGLSAFSAPTALFRPSPPSAIRRAVRICCAIFKHNYPRCANIS